VRSAAYSRQTDLLQPDTGGSPSEIRAALLIFWQSRRLAVRCTRAKSARDAADGRESVFSERGK
jgi:hypothetical protein